MIFEVICQYFYGTMESSNEFNEYVDAGGEDDAIDIFKTISEKYKDTLQEYNESTSPWEGDKVLSIRAYAIIPINKNNV